MLALFQFFGKSYPGWKWLRTTEGIRLLFPVNMKSKVSTIASSHGELKLTLYSARLEKPFLSVMLSIREYPMFSQVPSDQVFAEWRAEHDRTLEEAGICLHLLKINQTLGKFPGYELLFSNKDETTFTRVYQIYDGSKLVTLTAIGSLEAVSCAVCSKAFQSLHLA